MFDFIVPSFIIPDLLLLLFPFIVIGSRLFCDAKSNVPWRIANIGFLLIFMLLNFIPLAGGEGRFFICNWRVDDFGVFMREVLVVSAILGMWFSTLCMPPPASPRCTRLRSSSGLSPLPPSVA